MFLQSGDFIKPSEICYLSIVRTKPGDRRWNATMTHEIVDPDIHYIELKLATHAIRLEYEDIDNAQKEYEALKAALPQL